jgi:arabinofuranan 3-O-arabinosyltransferase
MTQPNPSASLQRLRLGAVCLVITLLVFTQSSGLTAADTKLDLVVAPWHFLVTATSAWDPTADGGTLQNQAYGYLFPMGPFFLIGHLMQLPPWVIQRSWESAVLVAAFLGVFRLSRLLGTVGWWPRVAAGLTYALAPRMLMEIGIISSELLPVAVLPWVLIPLVRGSREGSPRRAAAWSGVALLFAGGTNAAATLAILPVPVLWLLTRRRGPRRGALMRWWTVAVALSCLWWAIPLLVLGKYSPPFLDWIESAAVTTSPTSLAATLRGVEHWEAYLGSNVWPAGFIFVTQRTVIFATAAVAALGIVGITLRRTPHRLFLGTCLATGLILTTFGHVASIGPIAGLTERNALDGALNAFRNIHKFDPVLRLPIALGVGQLMAAAIARWDQPAATATRHQRWTGDPRVTGAVAAICLAIGAVAPAVTGTVIPELHQVNDPSWWSQAADWLDQQGEGRALVVPGAAQPIYFWGSPRDDALQPVARSPWAVRDSIPLAQAGYIRLLDEVEASLAAGRADPTLAALLARSGIRYVVVRNDLDTSASDATALPFVYATLDNSPDFQAVKQFGPNLVSVSDPNRLVDDGATTTEPAITVFDDSAWTGNTALLPLSQAVEANGSADSLPALTAAGVTPNQPVIFAPSALPGDPTVTTAMTDGIRRREFGFGGIRRYSDTMTATQPFRQARAAHDYLPTPTPALSTVSYLGIRDVEASSSGSDATAVTNISPANGPWSAIDGNPFTAWRPGDFGGAVGQWLQVDLDSSRRLAAVTASFVGLGRDFPVRVEVTTDAGQRDDDVVPDGSAQPIRLPPGSTQFIRLTILRVADGSTGRAAGIATLSIPGVDPSRTLDIPGASRPDLITFTVADGNRGECLTVNGTPACEPAWAASGEEDTSLDRSFTLSAGATYDTRALVRVQPGQALDQLLDRGQPLSALASSVDSPDPRERPGAAVDGDLATGWEASRTDLKPTLVIGTRHRQRLAGILLEPLTLTAARAPVEIRLTAGSESVKRRVPADGLIDLPHPVSTKSVSIHVIRAALRITTSSATGKSQFLPVGIAEVDLLGTHEPAARLRPNVRITCRDGLGLTVDGQDLPLRVDAPRQAALAGDPVAATPCPTPGSRALQIPPSWLRLGKGQHRLTLNADNLTDPVSMLLSRVGQPHRAAPTSLPVSELQWSATSRAVQVKTRVPALLVVHENANQGWQATYDGRSLPAITVDGWQQAWLVPAGANGVVRLRFAPQATFRAGLIGGAAAVVVLLVLTLPLARLRRRRTVPAPRLRAISPGPIVRWGVVVVSLTLLGSITGLVVAAVLLVANGVAPTRLRGRPGIWALAAAVAAVAVTETIATAASRHPLAGSAGVQLLCLVAIGLALVRCLDPGRRSPRAGEPA